ncbi:hypothetical protein HHI36_021835 [Cryptolaemus montrouzieri]|uniref:THAP-type domain-containing protein n=1 Tax=Cryptolaemus montrouzieri TaxID=559131 RepID=A0ABD2MYY6_9CUCU
MNSNVYRWCAVPQCNNTSIKTPNMLFVNVSMKKKVRNMWLNLARRDPAAISSNSVIYFCEDHFDLPNDMENYMQYHVMGSVSQVRMKPGCIPKKFECQRDEKTQTSNAKNRTNISKKRKMIVPEECEKQLEESCSTEHLAEIVSGSSDLKPISNSENSECNEELTDQKCIDIKEEPVDIKTESDYLYSCENDNEVFPKEEGYNLGEYVKIIFNSLKNPSTKIIFKKKLHELISEMYDLENCQNG